MKSRFAGDKLPRVEVTSRAEWRSWLAAHHASSSGVWLVTFKRSASPAKYVAYDDIVDEAICFGWVDSTPREVDARRSMRLVAPRKPKSSWSAKNKERVARLERSGAMTKAGRDVIERAKADGSWGRLDAVEALTVPKDLALALRAAPPAAAEFAAFPRSSKRLILEWIGAAKQPATRARRIAETARLAARGLRANHYRQPGTARRRTR